MPLCLLCNLALTAEAALGLYPVHGDRCANVAMGFHEGVPFLIRKDINLHNSLECIDGVLPSVLIYTKDDKQPLLLILDKLSYLVDSDAVVETLGASYPGKIDSHKFPVFVDNRTAA